MFYKSYETIVIFAFGLIPVFLVSCICYLLLSNMDYDVSPRLQNLEAMI